MVTREQFREALISAPLRAGIGLVISDADAAALLSNPVWEQNYYDKWVALGQAAAEAKPSPVSPAVPAEVPPTAWPSFQPTETRATTVGPAYSPGLPMTGAAAPQSRKTSWVRRTLKIIAITVGVLLALIIGLSVVVGITGAGHPTASTSQTATTPSADAAQVEAQKVAAEKAKAEQAATEKAAADKAAADKAADEQAAAAQKAADQAKAQKQAEAQAEADSAAAEKANPAQPAVSYANCAAVRAAGAAPIHRGEPGYSTKLDRDGDGTGCE